MKKYLTILIITIATQGLSLLGNLYFANTVTVNLYSNYVSALSLTTITATIFLLGIPQYLVREVIVNQQKANYIFYILLSIVFYVTSTFLIKNYFLDNDFIYFLIPFGFIIIVSTYLSSYYQTSKSFYKMSLTQVGKDISKILFLIMITIQGFKNIENTLIWSSIFVMSVLLIIAYSEHKTSVNEKIRLKESIQFSFPFLISSLSYTIYYQSDIVVLTHYGYTSELASYSLVITMMTAGLVVNNTLYQKYLLPIFYDLHTSHKKEAKRLCLKYFIITLILVIPFYMAYSYFGDILFGYLINKKYYHFMEYMDVIIFAVIIRYLYSPLGLIMNLKKDVTKKSKILISAAIINVVLNVFLIPHYGPKMVCYTTVITESYVMLWFIIVFFIRNRSI